MQSELDKLEPICRAICEAKGYDPDAPAGETRVQWQCFTELARSTVLSEQQPVGDMGKLVEWIAAIIAPDWFPDNGPHHVLNNYPEQADNYRKDARNKAAKILEATAIEQLQSNVERLTKVLEPFAKAALYIGPEQDCVPCKAGLVPNRAFREAAKALSNTTHKEQT